MGWKRLVTLVAVLGLIALTTDIGKAQTKKPIVRLNYSGSIYATTSVVGVEKGFFDQEGLIMNATPESAGEIVMQNVFKGGDIDMLKFPVPMFHASDGGRYIGTGDALINRDPDSGFINMGTYRQEVHSHDLLGLWMSPGQQGRQIAQRYWDRGEA